VQKVSSIRASTCCQKTALDSFVNMIANASCEVPVYLPDLKVLRKGSEEMLRTLLQLARFRLWSLYLIVRSANLRLLAAWVSHNMIKALTLFVSIQMSDVMAKVPFYNRMESVGLPDGSRADTDFVGLSVIVSVYFERLYETFRSFRPRKGWVVVDGGAHMGLYTIRAASMVGAEGKVIAVEPDARNFAILERNIKANGLTNVLAVKAALANEVGVGKLSTTRMSTTHYLADLESPGSIAIQTLTLDSLLQQSGLGRVDLIKLDVEGAELRVLEGAKNTLLSSTAKFVVEPSNTQSAIKVENLLKQYRQSVRGVYTVALPGGEWPPTVYAW
jgi:FkbM family methyltransferase